MDCQEYTTSPSERKRYQHLRREDRGAIQALHRQGFSNRAIARELGCSPSTVGNELARGTPPRKGSRGRIPGYSAKHGHAVYQANRERCRKPHKVANCQPFVAWVATQIREHHWSLDACVGYARLHALFPPEEMVCTRTLYHEVWANTLPLHITELPEALKRKQTKGVQPRKNKKIYGKSIDDRPESAANRTEEGHWEGDTVVGKRNGKEAVVLSLLEKKTETYLAFLISGKTSEAVMSAMVSLKGTYGDKFSQVFKSITVDNGPEFAEFAKVEDWGTEVYFSHPYTSWERAQNERHNGLFRAYVPKGQSMECYGTEEIMSFADELNGRPRRKLGYHTPEELFDAFLDQVYTASRP